MLSPPSIRRLLDDGTDLGSPGSPLGISLPIELRSQLCSSRCARWELCNSPPLPSLPSLRLEAVVERSCSACYKCPSPLFSVVFSVFFWSFSVRLDSALLLCSLPALQTLPVQCDPLAYCGTLVAAGYYPKYLGNLALPASERMNQTFNLEAWKAAVYQVTLKSGSYWIMAVCQAARFRPSVRSLRNQESSREGFRGR